MGVIIWLCSLRALEGSFRSVNNLLETLHHAEFFYFNSATWRFVSIGLYMPALAFLIAPLVMEVSSGGGVGWPSTDE